MSHIAVPSTINTTDAIRQAVDAEQRRKQRDLASDSSVAYLREHNLPAQLNAIIERLLVDMPPDPLKKLEEQLRLVAKRGTSPPGERHSKTVAGGGAAVAGGGAAVRQLRHGPSEASGESNARAAREKSDDKNVNETTVTPPPEDKLSADAAIMAAASIDRASTHPTPRDENEQVAAEEPAPLTPKNLQQHGDSGGADDAAEQLLPAGTNAKSEVSNDVDLGEQPGNNPEGNSTHPGDSGGAGDAAEQLLPAGPNAKSEVSNDVDLGEQPGNNPEGNSTHPDTVEQQSLDQ